MSRSPNCYGPFVNRGVIMADAGQYDKAIAEFSAAISRDPEYANAFAGRGGCYLKRHEFDKAHDDCRAALNLNPRLPGRLSAHLSLAYVGLREFDKALTKFTKAIETDPRDARNFVGRDFRMVEKS